MHKLIEDLAVARPNIHIAIHWRRDLDFVWDGDGPEPTDEVAHDVEVVASAIVQGQMYQGRECLGGAYAPWGGPFDPDVHGYFPQMLEAAVAELDGFLSADTPPGV